MEYILEGIVTIAAALVYGTEERPRPAILRNTVRVVGFGGAALALATLIGILQLPPILAFATPVWVLCLLIVLMVEHVIDRTVLSFAALLRRRLGCGASQPGSSRRESTPRPAPRLAL